MKRTEVKNKIEINKVINRKKIKVEMSTYLYKFNY